VARQNAQLRAEIQAQFAAFAATGLALDHARQADAALGEDAGDLGEHAWDVVDCQPQIAARPDLAHRKQLGARNLWPGRLHRVAQGRPRSVGFDVTDIVRRNPAHAQ